MDIHSRYAEALARPGVWITADFLALGAVIGTAYAIAERNPVAMGEYGAVALGLLGIGGAGELISQAQARE